MVHLFSCQYGERCRYLHVQQQRKPNVNGFGGQSSSYQQQNTNPFGFGSGSGSQQQQKGNPFGFGKQNSSQLNGGPHSEHKPNQYKVRSHSFPMRMHDVKVIYFYYIALIVRHYNK